MTTPVSPKISQVRHVPIARLLKPVERGSFPMDGFDDEFGDIIDYIFKITHWIWADKAVGQIYDYYAETCTVYTGFDVTHSVQDVVTGTLAMMQSFPDRSMDFVNVAWSGDPKEGFYTSHLGFSRMTNLGPSSYGPSTGRPSRFFTVADCVSRDNQIFLEWLIRDNGAVVRQLGLDIHELAKKLAQNDARQGKKPWFADKLASLPVTRGSRQAAPLARPTKSIEDRLRHILHDAWNRRLLNVLSDFYDPDAVGHIAGGHEISGREALIYHYVQLLAAIPDAEFSFDHYCDVVETDGVLAAVRWSIMGHHHGDGLFGPPSGKAVYILGMSHFRFEGEKVVEEWTLYDELSILRQIYAEPAAANGEE